MTGRGFTLWITGLPCSGKTTLAERLCARLSDAGHKPELLDGDALRRTLSPDLGYTRSDREEHGRRVTDRARLAAREGRPVVVSLVSPYRSMREHARRMLHPYIEVFLDCPLEVCESRDVKGMYRLARIGRIERFTGVSDEYERPDAPELSLRTDVRHVEECADAVWTILAGRRLV